MLEVIILVPKVCIIRLLTTQYRRVSGSGGGGGGGGGGGTTDISNAFDSSFNDPNGKHYSLLIRLLEANQGWAILVVFQPHLVVKHLTRVIILASYPDAFKNALTVRDGNLSVITPSGDTLKITNASQSAISANYTDQSGGIIFSRKTIVNRR